MGLCGPENNNGCLKTLFAKLRDKCRKKKEEKIISSTHTGLFRIS
jgi:hypothetical protein